MPGRERERGGGLCEWCVVSERICERERESKKEREEERERVCVD